MTALMPDFIAAENKQTQSNGKNHIDHLLLLNVMSVDRLAKGGRMVDDR